MYVSNWRLLEIELQLFSCHRKDAPHTPSLTPQVCCWWVVTTFLRISNWIHPTLSSKSLLIYSPHAIRDGGASPAASFGSRCWSTKVLFLFICLFWLFSLLILVCLYHPCWFAAISWQSIRVTLFLVSTSLGALQQIKQGKKVGLMGRWTTTNSEWYLGVKVVALFEGDKNGEGKAWYPLYEGGFAKGIPNK